MSTLTYEKVPLADPNFPLTFHDETTTEDDSVGFILHWHEHIEILYFTNGSVTFTINNAPVYAQKGDIVVINSNALHSMLVKPRDCTFHCLILDKSFFESYFISIDNLNFCECIQDKCITDIYEAIIKEMQAEVKYYKPMVKALSISLLVLLSRKYSTPNLAFSDKGDLSKLKMVKKAISYMSSHYKESLDISEIANYVGFSKYYFCHVFKEITGQTALDYINALRCNHAKKLLSSGMCNISESALLSGFQNQSYFTKTYKKHMGTLPSQDKNVLTEQ